ncbi:MAG: hypothetical protein M1383_01565 [Patescibacteria group bacterium]|nr:hypothetical protein [Patescibacteria group bacterium]
MSLIDKIRQKPQEEKLRIIWTAAIAAAVALIALWALTAKYLVNKPKDTTLFQKIGEGIKGVQENFKK